MLRQQIPIRGSVWEEGKPGCLEVDTVALCGGSVAGEFVWMVDGVAAVSALSAIHNRRPASEVIPPLNVAMADASSRCHGGGMHTTEESVRLIENAQSVELMAFSPDGDPLAMVPIAKSTALTLIAMSVTMGHVFRAASVAEGRVFLEAIDANGHAGR